MESHEYWRHMAYTMEMLLEKAPTETDRRLARHLKDMMELYATMPDRPAVPPVEHDP
jgi:hypothetical protein